MIFQAFLAHMKNAGELFALGQQREIIARDDPQRKDKYSVYDDGHRDRRTHADEHDRSAAILGKKEARAERIHAARGEGHRKGGQQWAQEVAGIIEMEGCDARDSDEV